jgi:hypothetical protein
MAFSETCKTLPLPNRYGTVQLRWKDDSYWGKKDALQLGREDGRKNCMFVKPQANHTRTSNRRQI